MLFQNSSPDSKLQNEEKSHTTIDGNGDPDVSLGGGNYRYGGDATHQSDFRS